MCSLWTRKCLLLVGLEINIEVKCLKFLEKIDRVIKIWSLYFVFFNFCFYCIKQRYLSVTNWEFLKKVILHRSFEKHYFRGHNIRRVTYVLCVSYLECYALKYKYLNQPILLSRIPHNFYKWNKNENESQLFIASKGAELLLYAW